MAALRGYRQLLRCVTRVEAQAGIYCQGGLRQYVSLRFRQHVRSTVSATSTRVPSVEEWCNVLYVTPSNAEMTSMLQVLAAGVGSVAYQQEVERGLFEMHQFEQQKRDRDEEDDVGVSERQNRLLQHALHPYVAQLQKLHSDAPPSALQERMGEGRGGASVHVLTHGDDVVAVEIDETLNKQTIYLRTEPFRWSDPLEHLEVSEVDALPNTIAHADYLASALRLADATVAETPLHRARGTVVVAHGAGGAVALLMALQLRADSFSIKNVVTVGSPKGLIDARQRDVVALNAVRIVATGDPLVEMPVSSSEGKPFIHVGEVLLLSNPAIYERRKSASSTSPSVEKATKESKVFSPFLQDVQGFEDEEAGDADVEDDDDRFYDRRQGPPAGLFGIDFYHELLSAQSTTLQYAEGDEVWDEGGRVVSSTAA